MVTNTVRGYTKLLDVYLAVTLTVSSFFVILNCSALSLGYVGRLTRGAELSE